MLKSLWLASAAAFVLSPNQAFAQTAPAIGSQERAWSAGAEKVGAFTSRAWASRGSGVTIAIVDSGIRTDHIEFTGAIVGGFDASTNRTGLSVITDTLGHGTHVASLAAGRADGRGMIGVASKARILAIKVFEGPSASDAIIANGIRYATAQRAFAINLSLGGGQSTAIKSALQGAVNAGQVVVVAAGNEGAANPSWPARHASEAWANGQIIAVGAVDANNTIASFSNRAGDAKNFFVVAPGVSLIGAYPTSASTYAYMSGTSMATPIVTGAVAVVKSAWPYLAAKDVANVIFLTATDLGTKGIDPIYGRGLVNLDRAMQPVGAITAVGATGSRPLALAATTSAVTIGAMSVAQRSGALTGAVFDSFGRDFAFDFGGSQLSVRADTLAVLSSVMDRRIDAVTATDENGGLTFVAFAPNENDERLDQMSMAYLQADGSGWAATKGAASPLLDAPAAPRLGLAPVTAEFANAHSMLDRSASSVAFRTAFGAGDSLTFGLSHQARARFNETLVSPDREVVGATNVQIGAQRQMDRLALSLGLSFLKESDGRLGESSTSMFAVSGDARTLSTQFGAALALTDRVTIGAQATAARTAAQKGLENGLVTQMGETSSLAYAVTLAASDMFAAGDRLDLALGQPLMSQSGAMDIALATGADFDTGAPIVERRRVSLATDTPETRLELGYTRRLGATRVAAMSRFDADGEPGRDVHAFMLRTSTQF
jgi:Subtilase family